MMFLKQRLSFNDKIKNNYEWAKNHINRLLDSSYSYWGDNSSKYEDKSRIQMMARSYKLYNNQIDQEDLDKDINLLGIDIGQKKDQVMPYNKAHNKINTLIGELIKRPFNYKAILTNAEGAKALTEVRKKMLVQYIEAEIQKNLAREQFKNQQNITPEQYEEFNKKLEEEFQDVLDPEGIEDYLLNEYLEPREIKCNKLLDVILKEQNLLDKKKDSFKHGLLSDEEHAWVGVESGKVVIKILNPMGVGYHKSPDIKYIQDGDYAYYTTKMSVSDILDTFKNLKKEDIKLLEEKYSDQSKTEFDGDYNFRHTELNYLRDSVNPISGQYGDVYNDQVEVSHVEWRSQRKIGFFSYIDDNNELQEEIVDEYFPFDKENPKHISIEWDWIPEIWEGVRIDRNIYVDIRPVPYQYIDSDNPYYQPLRYCGIVYNNTNAFQISTMERMRPFQMLFLIVMHKLKKLIARDKGMVIPIDVSRLPGDMELEEVLYYLDELDVLPYSSLENANEPGAAQRAGIDSAINRSSSNHIMQYIQILNYLDEQIGEVAGVTRPREGQTSPYDAVTNVQQSIIQSSNITEILFDAHVKHWEKVLNRAVELAIQITNDEGYESYSVNDKMQRNSVSIDKGELSNCKFGIFVVDSARDNDVFNQLKSLSQLVLQSDKGRFSDVIKMIKQKSSIEELTRDIEKFEKSQQETANQQFQMQQQADAQKIQVEKEIEDIKFQHEVELKKMDIEGKIRVAEITSFIGQKDQDVNDDGIPDQLEVDKLALDRERMNLDSNIQKDKTQLEREKINATKEKAKLDSETKLKVAKMRPKPTKK